MGRLSGPNRKLKTLKMKSLILNYRSMRDKRNEEVFIKDINGIAEVDEVIVVPIDIPELKTSTVQNDDNYERENVQTGGEEVHVQEEKSESNTSSQSIKPKPEKLSGLTLTDWMY